jgi:HSP20 family protein
MQTGSALAPRRSFRSLAKLDPFEFAPNRLNRIFEGLGLVAPLMEESVLAAWTPPCDIFETDKALVLRLELTGIKKEDVFVSIENNLVIIRGERKLEADIPREKFHRVERNFGEFFRSFTLPNYVDPAKIIAEFKDGLLEVNLPKREEALPKQVQIKVK